MRNKREERARKQRGLPQLLDIKDIAYMLGLRVSIVTQMIEDGDFIPPLRLAGQQRWRKQDVLRFLRQSAASLFTVYLDRQQGKVKVLLNNPAHLPQEIETLRTQVLEFLEFPPCVYFLLANGRIMYVGKTRRLSVRIINHRLGNKKRGTPPRQFDRVLYMPLPPEVLAATELQLIKRLYPPWNNQGAL